MSLPFWKVSSIAGTELLNDFKSHPIRPIFSVSVDFKDSGLHFVK
jgi:hypothetical protein